MRLDDKLIKGLLYDKTFEGQHFTATDGIKLSEYIEKHSQDAAYIYGTDDIFLGDVYVDDIPESEIGDASEEEDEFSGIPEAEDMPLLMKDGLGRYFVFRLLGKTEKEGTIYCVFEPLTRFVNFDEEDVVVFRLCFDGDGSEYLVVETDDIADVVIDELDPVLSDFEDQDFLKDLLDPVNGDKLTVDMNGRKFDFRRLALIYRDGCYYGVLERVSSKGNLGPQVFKIDMLNVGGMDLLYDDELEKQIMDEYESTRRK